jgi:deoxycytidylate deaminase
MTSVLIINKLQCEALGSIIDHKLAAAIISHNKILGRAYCNIPKNRPYIKQEGTIHAEVNAIIHWVKNNPKRKSRVDIVVIRVNKYGIRCNARPCYNCLLTMKQIGIRRVYYSVNAIDIIYENVKDMISIQVSSYNRLIYNFNKSLGIDKYYESILLEVFPDKIKLINLMNFINYNFYNVLPKYKIIINHNIVIIIDSNNNTIKTSSIII